MAVLGANRYVLEAVLWILNTGAQWHMLPQSYPNYKTVHRRFQTWCRDGYLIYQVSTSELYGRVQQVPRAVLSAVTACSCEALCLLDRGELSGGVRIHGATILVVPKTALFEVRPRGTIFGTSKWPPSDCEIGS